MVGNMRIVILDRDKQNIEYLAGYIKSHYSGWSVNCYTNSFALVTAVYDEFKGDVELLIIHVDASGESVELAKDLQEYFPHIRVIFYSETTDCAEDIFRAIPTFFLKLPLRDEMTSTALERVRMNFEEDVGRTVTIQSHGQKQKIRFSAIRYVESVGRKLILYTDEGAYETYMTIADALGKLPSQFAQCHRSYIVNLERIETYDADGSLLIGTDHVPVSRTYQKTIRALFQA